jgi:hypothetical protein
MTGTMTGDGDGDSSDGTGCVRTLKVALVCVVEAVVSVRQTHCAGW